MCVPITSSHQLSGVLPNAEWRGRWIAIGSKAEHAAGKQLRKDCFIKVDMGTGVPAALIGAENTLNRTADVNIA